ncbi:hypothetical protein Tco_1351630 [Tanacetum coccineum]
MGDKNPIRTLEDYSKPSHEGYRNTIDSRGSISTWEDLTTRESLSEAWNHFKNLLQKVPHHGIDRWLQIQIFYYHVSFHLKCEVDCAGGGKLCDKNTDESWEILENLALYDHEGWNDSKDSIKPVKEIFVSPNASNTPDRRLLEFEDQINFLLKGSKLVPRASSTNVPQAYGEAISSNHHEPPRKNSFTFCECARLNPLPEALGTNFKDRVRDYMAAHTERMERATDKSMAEPSKSDEQEPPKEVDKTNEGRRRADDEPAKGARENVTKNKEEEPSRSFQFQAFDKGMITLKSRKSKTSFHRIPEPHCRIEKESERQKTNFPTTTINMTRSTRPYVTPSSSARLHLPFTWKSGCSVCTEELALPLVKLPFLLLIKHEIFLRPMSKLTLCDGSPVGGKLL